MIRVRWYDGEGSTLLVLHGGPGAPGSAAGLARVLAGRFRVGEPMQRRSGHGQLTVARHVADLAEVVARCPEPPALVGHSWGAMLALAFVAEHPGAARALALVGCGTFDPAARAELGRRLEARLAAASFEDLGALMGELENVDPLPEEAPVRVDARGHRESWEDMLRLQAEGMYPAAFSAYRGPILMLHGAVDPHPGRMIRDTLARVLPQLEYLELASCGHEPWRERGVRREFCERLGGWLCGGALEAS